MLLSSKIHTDLYCTYVDYPFSRLKAGESRSLTETFYLRADAHDYRFLAYLHAKLNRAISSLFIRTILSYLCKV